MVAALWFTQTVNSEFAALHRRLDKHEHLIGALEALLPVRPIPSEQRPPAP